MNSTILVGMLVQRPFNKSLSDVGCLQQLGKPTIKGLTITKVFLRISMMLFFATKLCRNIYKLEHKCDIFIIEKLQNSVNITHYLRLVFYKESSLTQTEFILIFLPKKYGLINFCYYYDFFSSFHPLKHCTYIYIIYK